MSKKHRHIRDGRFLNSCIWCTFQITRQAAKANETEAIQELTGSTPELNSVYNCNILPILCWVYGMMKVLPSQTDLEEMLIRLRQRQTESPTLDGKADLSLDTEGDRAFFIRHIAALANNVEASYLIIGIEDRTWIPVGLPTSSPLLNPDQTQQRMNQILANKLDPNLFIRYTTYQLGSSVLGVVGVQGSRAPYVIAINDVNYGGNRTRGEPDYIYRGAMYIRQGSSSITSNRKSDILAILDKAKSNETVPDEANGLLLTNNYLDVDSDTFGRHALSNRLVEAAKKSGSNYEIDYEPAKSWVSFVFYPLDRTCQLNTVTLKANLEPDKRIGRGGEWFRMLPRHFGDMFWRAKTTPREYVATFASKNTEDAITDYFRVLPSGYIEFATTYPLFFDRDGFRFYSFVAIIGYFWQIFYLNKAIYQDSNYNGEVALLLNLIGSHGTILGDFAQGHNGGWLSPFDPMCQPAQQEKSRDSNIQIKRSLSLAMATDNEIETMIRGIARELGEYYGQDRPRCFDCNTNEFPVRDYLEHHVRF